MSHKKFGPDRFSRFYVYWIQTDRQTNKQTNKQTDKPNLYIDIYNIYIFRYIHYINTTVQMTGRFQNKIITQGQFILIRG